MIKSNRKETATLAIVIVNWNSGSFLRNCISSIEEAIRVNPVRCRVVVVDNASTDDSLSGITGGHIEVVLVRNSVNLGFAAACNQGASLVCDKYLLFLNPDTRLFNDSLFATIQFMEDPANSFIGVCGIKLLDERGDVSTCAARFPTLKVVLGKSLLLNKIFPKFFPKHFMSPDELKKSRFVNQIIGAFFLTRRDVFSLCGGFDERFYVYYEEVDYSLRINKYGYTSYYLSEVSAYHEGGGCSNQVRALRLFYSLRSRLQYTKKHCSSYEYFVIIILTGIEFPIRLAVGVRKASLSIILDTVSAYFSLVKYKLGKMLCR